MKFKGTLWLILIFIALGLYLALVEVPSEKKKDEEAIRAQQVLHFRVEEVQEFDLIRKDQTFKFKRDPVNTRWNLVEPLAVGGDSSVINQLLLVLEEAELTRVVEESPKSLKEYGLEDPRIKIHLRFKTGDPQTLLVGGSSPLGHTTYLKTEKEARVLLSSLDVGQLLPGLNDLRSKLLLSFVPRDITAIDIKYEGETQSLSQQGGVWKLTAPSLALGDADEISNFLDAVRLERIETFIAETAEEAKIFGLETPRIEITLKAEKAGKTWTLKIGKAYDDHSFYARRASTETIFTVADSLVETLSRRPLSFMQKSLIDFKEEDVTEIENREGETLVQVVRDPEKTGRWKFKETGPEGVDSATVNTLLLDLKEARISEYAPPVSNLKLFGLDAPQKSLTVHQKEGASVTFQLGNTDKEGKHYFAARSTDQSIFKLEAETVNKLFRSSGDYINKKLLKFDPEQVARISIQTPKQTFRLEKQDNHWVLQEPEKLEELKPFVGKDILWTLNNLEYEKKLGEEVRVETTGLDHPRLIVSLEDRELKSLGQIKIGNSLSGQPLVFGQLTGSDPLYQIKDRILGEIPSTLNQFRKKEG